MNFSSYREASKMKNPNLVYLSNLASTRVGGTSIIGTLSGQETLSPRPPILDSTRNAPGQDFNRLDDSVIGSVLDGLNSKMDNYSGNYDRGLKACINNYNIKTFYSTRMQPFFR